MTKVVSPSEVSPITSGQIAKFTDLQTAALRKSGLPSEQTQQVLETHGAALADGFVAEVRRHVEAVSNLIIRHAIGNRKHTPEEALKATGRQQYVTDSVVKAMPRGESAETDIYFFKFGRYVNDADLDKEYELRGLKPVDPYALAAVNEADPAFADEHPNGTHWKDSDGNWCYAAFCRWLGGERNVFVDRSVGVWDDYWFFAGVRK